MAEQHHVKGFEGFMQFMKDFKTGDKLINVLFSGQKDDQVSLSCFSQELLSQRALIF